MYPNHSGQHDSFHPPPQGYYQPHDPSQFRPGDFLPPHSLQHSDYWTPEYWSYQHPPPYENFFNGAATADIPYGYHGSPGMTQYSHSESGCSRSSSRCLIDTSSPQSRVSENEHEHSWNIPATKQKAMRSTGNLLVNLLSAKIVKRKENNKMAQRKSRTELKKKAAKGEHYEKILQDMKARLVDLAETIQRLHLPDISQFLLQAGVDTYQLVDTVVQLKENMPKEIQ